jgi:hypothetical protein
MNNIFNLNASIICAVFDNSNNLYVATRNNVCLFNSSHFNTYIQTDTIPINTKFNNIKSITNSNGVIYFCDLVIDSDIDIYLNIYKINQLTLTATLCNSSNKIYSKQFIRNYPTNVFGASVDDDLIKLNTGLVVNNNIFFINSRLLSSIYSFNGDLLPYTSIRKSILTCNINGSNKKTLSNINYIDEINNKTYLVYGNIAFYNNKYYLFGLTTTYISKYLYIYNADDDGYYPTPQYSTNNQYKFMYINQNILDSYDSSNISFVDTSCNDFIYSTITTTGNIYIYETNNINYFINVYNDVGYIKNVYTNALDIITGLISDNKGNAYAIQKNNQYSSIILLDSNIGELYKIDYYNGNSIPCFNLYAGSYMYRSFMIIDPLRVFFTFDAYLYDKCSAYFNFFTTSDGTGGGCLCLSNDISYCGITNSVSLSLGNNPTDLSILIPSNIWYTYNIRIDASYNVTCSISNSVKEKIKELTPFKLNPLSYNNNYCSFISSNNNLLIDNIYVSSL